MAKVPPRMTEPTTVQCLLMTGFDIEVIDDLVRLIAWVDVPITGYDGPERRIIARVAMPNNTGRALQRELSNHLSRGDN
jgi:hypothetical protein